MTQSTTTITEKRCTNCGDTKPIEAFHRNRRTKSGFAFWCKSCVSADHHRRYHADIDKSRAAGRHEARRNAAQRAAYMRRYIRTENGRERRAQYVRDHRRSINADSLRSYYRDHQRNKDRVLRSSHRTRARSFDASLVLDYTTEQLHGRFDIWGWRCWLCGTDDGIEVDHVKPLSRGGPDCLGNTRPICGTCNKRKSNTWPFDANAFRNRFFRSR